MRTTRLLAGIAGASAVAMTLSACGPKHTTQFRAAPTALEPVSCIAVLPFENLSDDPAAGDAMADVVATELLKSGRFQVMDRAEAARILSTRGIYLDATIDAAQARVLGDVLGVQAVMVGSVDEWKYAAPARHDRAARPTIGVTTRLVDVKTGDPLWGASFTGSPASFFSDSTAPLHVAAQRVAMDLSGGLLEGAGSTNPPEAPCWTDKAQSVLATLAPGVSGTAVASASTPAPTPTPAHLVATAATPTPAPTAAATPEPTPAAPAAKPLTASQTALLEKMKPGATFLLTGVTFPGTTTRLVPSANAILADLGAVLAAHPEARVRIEAHVDPTDRAPVPLSQKRAEIVVARIVASGAAATQVEPKGLGGSKSLFPSFVEAMKAKNRRIEVAVLAAPKEAPAVASSATENGAPQEVARVKVLASKGKSGSAVRLANALKRGGTHVTAVAAVSEARRQTLVYFLPPFRAQAQKLAGSIAVPGGAKISPANSLGAGVDIVILVGADLK